MKRTAAAIAVSATLWAACECTAANYDESKVPKYTLPDPLVCADGSKVTDADTWRNKRRPEILKLFETHVYGRSQPAGKRRDYKITSIDKSALGGKAIRKQVSILFTEKKDGPRMHLLIYLPAAAKKPVPAFVGLNFRGNHSIQNDPGIKLSTAWQRGGKPATEQSRGSAASRWPVDKIVARGYAIATAYYGDIDPDFHDGFKNGVHGLHENIQDRKNDSWGSIAAWAWGLSRALDYLETDSQIDHQRVAVLGHSRLGKTSLWAGASDQRFALVISNNSGCGGAALNRRAFGETVKRINTSFPHWFCDNFKKFNDNEAALPVDQHMLIALIAPRPVYVASAVEDRWADPRGEFLAAKNAGSVYRLLGTDAMAAEEMPKINQRVMSTIGYHIRQGKHDVTNFDWQTYIDFADKHMVTTGK
ncbi:MAG: acetylxylan esterase [Pirellulales bacterium]